MIVFSFVFKIFYRDLCKYFSEQGLIQRYDTVLNQFSIPISEWTIAFQAIPKTVLFFRIDFILNADRKRETERGRENDTTKKKTTNKLKL